MTKEIPRKIHASFGGFSSVCRRKALQNVSEARQSAPLKRPNDESAHSEKLIGDLSVGAAALYVEHHTDGGCGKSAYRDCS